MHKSIWLTVIALWIVVVTHSGFASTIVWSNPGGGSWFEPANWSPAGVPSEFDTVQIVAGGTYSVAINGSQAAHAGALLLGGVSGVQTLSLDSPFDSLFLAQSGQVNAQGVLSLGNGVLFLVATGSVLSDHGLIAIDSAGRLNVADFSRFVIGPGASLLLHGSATIQGTTHLDSASVIVNSGNITKTGPGDAVLAANYGDDLEHNPGSIIVESGGILFNGLLNQCSGPIHIGPQAEIRVAGGTFWRVPTCTSTVPDSGLFSFASGPHASTYAGDFSFTGTLQALGGPIRFYPVTPSQITLRRMTVESDAEFLSNRILYVDILNMNGGTTNADIVVGSQYEWTAGAFVGSGGSIVTIGHDKILTVFGPAGKQLDGRSLYISGNATMSGSGELALSSAVQIVVNSDGRLTLEDSIHINGGEGDTLINHGEMVISSLLDTCVINVVLTNDPTSRTPGTIDILSDAVVTLGGDVHNGGTIQLGGNADLELLSVMNNNAAFNVGDGALCTVNQQIQNAPTGTVTLTGGAGIGGGGSVVNAGDVNRQGGIVTTPTNSIVSTPFENLATGHLNVAADTLTLAGGGTNAGDIYIAAGAVLRIMGSFTNLPGGVIHGEGTLDVVGAAFVNDGTISPGSSPGRLAVRGNFQEAGNIQIELAGTAPQTQYDQLALAGRVTLSGRLSFVTLNEFLPAVEDTFRFMSYTFRDGRFDTLAGTHLSNGTFLEVDYRRAGAVAYVCDGVSALAVSPGQISDTLSGSLPDTLAVQVCDSGNCPLQWTAVFEPISPEGVTWATLIGGEAVLLTRTECAPVKLITNEAVSDPGIYSGRITISSNDPGQPVVQIPVELIVPELAVDDLVARVTPDGNGIKLNWSLVPGANSYRVYRTLSDASGATLSVLIATVEVSSYNDAGCLLAGGADRCVYTVIGSRVRP